MPLSEDVLGSESDGSKNREFCKFCYHNGRFTHPDYSLEQMIEHLQSHMDKEKLPADIVEKAIGRLPHLKRWKYLPQKT